MNLKYLEKILRIPDENSNAKESYVLETVCSYTATHFIAYVSTPSTSNWQCFNDLSTQISEIDNLSEMDGYPVLAFYKLFPENTPMEVIDLIEQQEDESNYAPPPAAQTGMLSDHKATSFIDLSDEQN